MGGAKAVGLTGPGTGPRNGARGARIKGGGGTWAASAGIANGKWGVGRVAQRRGMTVREGGWGRAMRRKVRERASGCGIVVGPGEAASDGGGMGAEGGRRLKTAAPR